MSLTEMFVAGFVVIICVPVVLYFLYKYIRPTFPVKVSCWFCGAGTVVPYGNFNCWDCPSCEQYNGFNQDGDYNKVIPAQYSTGMNFNAPCIKDEFITRGNVLCERCSNNQVLKTKQLASFVPLVDANYDNEIEDYRQHLEFVYRLCYTCQANVHRELDKQDYLLQSKLDKLDQQSSDLKEEDIKSQRSFTSIAIAITRQLFSVYTLEKCLELVTFSFAVLLVVLDLHLSRSIQLAPLFSRFTLDILCALYLRIAIAGCCLSILTKLVVGKDRLHLPDAVSIPLWTVVILLSQTFHDFGILPTEYWLPLSFTCNLGNGFVSIYSIIMTRTFNNYSGVTIRRFSLDTSRNSSQSDTSYSAFTSVSQTFSRPPNSQGNQMLNEEKVLQQNGATASGDLNDTMSDFEAFSLGSVLNGMKNSDGGIFNSSFTSSVPSQAEFSITHSLRQRRPLISPAKLKVSSRTSSTPSKHTYSQSSVSGHAPFVINKGPKLSPKSENLFLQHPSTHSTHRKLFSSFTTECKTKEQIMSPEEKLMRLTGKYSRMSDTGSLFQSEFSPEIEDDVSQFSGRTTPSICPVDSTTKSEIIDSKGSFWKSPAVLGFVFGASIVGNMVLLYTSVYKQ